jgi:hypothetical protein
MLLEKKKVKHLQLMLVLKHLLLLPEPPKQHLKLHQLKNQLLKHQLKKLYPLKLKI